MVKFETRMPRSPHIYELLRQYRYMYTNLYRYFLLSNCATQSTGCVQILLVHRPISWFTFGTRVGKSDQEAAAKCCKLQARHGGLNVVLTWVHCLSMSIVRCQAAHSLVPYSSSSLESRTCGRRSPASFDCSPSSSLYRGMEVLTSSSLEFIAYPRVSYDVRPHISLVLAYLTYYFIPHPVYDHVPVDSRA